ncbi:MAG: outer membrane beta-barrel protein [Deltaproteobacteria bacterium]|nr:outer membrane beta-barrel protein [Deltaproteobacteria bacterium]MBI2342612.1 outer membrane beta-barrel protein [Deltaproteobacteria bacterium]MBI2974379.1 outer membrane beta-barrel protein [Deltaproteobacteria bacterium]
MKKIFALFVALFTFSILIQATAHARSSGFYIGGGYQQPVMLTWKKQSTVAVDPGSSIKFWPGFGGYLVGGYEFEKADWFGLAMPVSWSLVRLNKDEWVQLITADAEAIFHFMDSENKFDPYVAGLIGFNFLTEGSDSNGSQSFGPSFGAGFGMRYTLVEYAMAGSPNVTNLSFTAEVPVKIMLFVNDQELADSKTTPIISIPVKVGLTYSF